MKSTVESDDFMSAVFVKLTIPPGKFDCPFNRLGAEGWELVQVYEYRKFYFKRPSAA